MINRSFLNFPTVISTQQELLNCAKECTRRPLWLSHSHCSNTVTHSHIDSVLLCHMTNNFSDFTVHNGWLCPPLVRRWNWLWLYRVDSHCTLIFSQSFQTNVPEQKIEQTLSSFRSHSAVYSTVYASMPFSSNFLTNSLYSFHKVASPL